MPERYTVIAEIMKRSGLDSVCNYLDDILVHTAELEEHLDSIEKVLQAHLDAGIRQKPSKTLFFQEKMDFLGFQFSGDGMKPTEAHIQTIRDKQPPKTGKEVASLQGFLGYNGDFIPSFSRLTEVMNGLRNKQQLGPEDWTSEIDRI